MFGFIWNLISIGKIHLVCIILFQLCVLHQFIILEILILVTSQYIHYYKCITRDIYIYLRNNIYNDEEFCSYFIFLELQFYI